MNMESSCNSLAAKEKRLLSNTLDRRRSRAFRCVVSAKSQPPIIPDKHCKVSAKESGWPDNPSAREVHKSLCDVVLDR